MCANFGASVHQVPIRPQNRLFIYIITFTLNGPLASYKRKSYLGKESQTLILNNLYLIIINETNAINLREKSN